MSRRLTAQLRPRYVARLEISVVEDHAPGVEIGVMYPDVEIVKPGRMHEAVADYALDADEPLSAPLTLPRFHVAEVRLVTVEIRDAGQHQLITCIEILSPVNKHEPGLSQYRRKQQRLYDAGVHLIEIDLLRRGLRPLVHPRLPDVPYLVTLTRAGSERIDVWPITLQARLPVIPVPLRSPDPDARAFDDILAAQERLKGHIERTPCRYSKTLSEITGAQVWVKFENLQFTAAYKERGALNKLLQLTAEERSRGVIAASAGNHAQAVAYHAKRLGIPVTIVMPTATPTIKVTQTESHGARVLLHGDVVDESFAKAHEMERAEGFVFVHAFDDPKVIAGAGTIGLEMLEDAPELDTIVVPIGGGGLMSGVSIAARALKPDIELIGVEAELYPSMKCALDHGDRPSGGDTLAEGIAVKKPGELTSRILKELADDVVLVPERELERAVAMLVGIEKSVVEGAGAAGLAALLADPERFKGKKVATILCGGNIDTHLLANVLVRDLVRQGRIARLRVAAQDQPGALAAITAQFHDAGVNIIETNHSRIFTSLPAKDTVIEVECEARDPQAVDDVVSRLERVGFKVERASLD
jgi:threonine dehydratase